MPEMWNIPNRIQLEQVLACLINFYKEIDVTMRKEKDKTWEKITPPPFQ